MPKLTLALKRTSKPEAEPVRVLFLAGYVDAATYGGFEKALGILRQNRVRRLVLDFSGVEYINSTGIATIIRYAHDFREADGELLLAGVSREVGVTMHLLGLTQIVPVVRDARAGVRYFGKSGREGKSGGFFDYLVKNFRPDPSAVLRVRLPFRRKAAPRPPKASVLMVVPQADAFADVLRLRLHDPAAGKFHVLTSTQEALAKIETLNPDLIVLDDRVPGAEEFLAEVKSRQKRSLTSVLKLYGSDRSPKGGRRFKVWENDYLVEPFELRQLFHLAEAEIKRVPKDRESFLHQVRFQFGSAKENVEKARAMARSLILQVGFSRDHASMMQSAFNEAVDNAVHHGNRESAAKTVGVMFLVKGRLLVLTVEDEGAGFDPKPFLARALKGGVEELVREGKKAGARGGLGIALMRRCTDRLEYLGKANVVKLTKKIR